MKTAVTLDFSKEIIFHPAECWEGCMQHDCPYHHSPGWEYDGVIYASRYGAENAAIRDGACAMYSTEAAR